MDELLAFEHEGWEALSGPHGAEFYDGLLAPDAVMVFPSGIMDRASSLDAMRSAGPWKGFTIESSVVMRPTADVGVVAYHAVASRDGGDEYRAWMSSVYVRDADKTWKLVLHQQSPE